MKSYTDLEQSKKLSEFLPLESADMFYWCGEDIRLGNYKAMDKDLDVPCWSLAALLDVLPDNWWGYNKHYFLEISKMGDMPTPYMVTYFRFREQSDGANFGRIAHISFQSDNPLDACYKMIIELHERKLL